MVVYYLIILIAANDKPLNHRPAMITEELEKLRESSLQVIYDCSCQLHWAKGNKENHYSEMRQQMDMYAKAYHNQEVSKAGENLNKPEKERCRNCDEIVEMIETTDSMCPRCYC